MHATRRDCSRALLSAGNSIATRSATTAITTNSSTRVNPSARASRHGVVVVLRNIIGRRLLSDRSAPLRHNSCCDPARDQTRRRRLGNAGENGVVKKRYARVAGVVVRGAEVVVTESTEAAIQIRVVAFAENEIRAIRKKR